MSRGKEQGFMLRDQDKFDELFNVIEAIKKCANNKIINKKLEVALGVIMELLPNRDGNKLVNEVDKIVAARLNPLLDSLEGIKSLLATKTTRGVVVKPRIDLSALDVDNVKLTVDGKDDLLRTIKKLRKKGGTYKEIAEFLKENNISTFSGKGTWHAQTIHRLCGSKNSRRR